MKDTPLFPDLPLALSPRLAWLVKHNLITKYDPDLEGSPESPETGEDCHPWIVTQKDVLEIDQFSLGTGRTQDEAILDYCEKTGTLHWSIPPC